MPTTKRTFDKVAGTLGSSPGVPPTQPSRVVVLSGGMLHEEIEQHSGTTVQYLSHLDAGIAHRVLESSVPDYDPISSVLDPDPFSPAQTEARELLERTLPFTRPIPHDLAIVVHDPSRKFSLALKYHLLPLTANPIVYKWMAVGKTGKNGVRLSYEISSPWLTVSSVHFGLSTLQGTSPLFWFRENNFDQTVPQVIAKTVRGSHQRMLQALQFLATASLFQLSQAYVNVGLHFVDQEIDFFNVELALSFVVRGNERIWDPEPRGSASNSPQAPSPPRSSQPTHTSSSKPQPTSTPNSSQPMSASTSSQSASPSDSALPWSTSSPPYFTSATTSRQSTNTPNSFDFSRMGTSGPNLVSGAVTSSIEQDYGVTFEPINGIEKLLNPYQSKIKEEDDAIPSLPITLLVAKIITRWFQKNLPPLKTLCDHSPTLVSAALGDIPLPADGGYCPPAPAEVQSYQHKLATLRIMAAMKPEFVPEPDMVGVGTRLILPAILTSLPYGLLKMIIYSSALDSGEKYVLAATVVRWRRQRHELHASHHRCKTGQFIRAVPAGRYPADHVYRQPSLEEWPIRFRYVEIPFVVRTIDNNCRLLEVFDFKRYLYSWQVLTLEQMIKLLPTFNQEQEAMNQRCRVRDHFSAQLIRRVLGDK